MSTSVQRRRGTTAQHSSFAGLEGEITVDTTKDTVVVHDGATAGGNPLLREDGSNSALALGSAGTPSLKFTGDTNTGIYSPGADQVAISTGGSGRLFVDASGNVGVGTASPGAKLNVSGSSEALRFNHDDAYINFKNTADSGQQGFIQMRASDTSRIWVIASQALQFATANTERLRITSDGKLGLGTSSPVNNLQVNASAVAAVPSAGSSGHVAAFGSSAYGIAAGALTNGKSYFQVTRWDGTATNYDLLLNPNGGNVGIGTSSPSQLLHISSASGNAVALLNSAAANTAGMILQRGGTEVARLTSSATGTLSIATGSGATTALTIDNSQRVGIGTTDFAPASSYYDDLVVKNATAGTGCGLTLVSNATNGFSAVDFADTDAAGRGRITYSHADDSLRVDTAGSEAFRVDSSRRLLVGTSSSTTTDTLVLANNSSSTTDTAVLRMRRSGTIASGNSVGLISFENTDGLRVGASIQCENDQAGNWATGDSPGRLVFSTTADGASSPTERMRIRQDGLTAVFASSEALHISTGNTGASDTALVVRNGATAVLTGTNKFIVRADGDCENTNNSYGAISDLKLKENIVDANSQWDDLKALQVRNYNFKEGQTHTQIGLVAQEVELVSPGLVSESPDRDEEGNDLGTVTKSVNYSVLYMKAVKALQEAMERIEVLEAKVNALEGN